MEFVFSSLSCILPERTEMVRTEIKKNIKIRIACLKLFLSPLKSSVYLTKASVNFDIKCTVVIVVLDTHASINKMAIFHFLNGVRLMLKICHKEICH